MESKNSSLVSEEVRIDSMRCSRINCKNNGYWIDRNLDPTMRWEILYQRAKLRPEEYECEYDKAMVSEVDNDGYITWVKDDLERKSFPELKKIGLGLNVTARDKETMIKNILTAQSKKQ